jgi:hypothetical protein
LCDDNQEGESLYPYMRLLLPELDRERSTYGLKATSIARIVIECLGLETRHSDARKLLDWRVRLSRFVEGSRHFVKLQCRM